MLKMKMEDSTTLTNLFKAIGSVVDEANFVVSPEALKIKALDPSRTAMVDFELPKEAFSEYEVTEEIPLCLSLETVLKLMRKATKDENVEFLLNESTGKLEIKFTKENSVRQFALSTLEPDTQGSMPVPKLNYLVTAKLVVSDFKSRIEDAQLTDTIVTVTAQKEKIVMDTEGSLISSHSEIKKGSMSLVSYEVKEESRAIYTLLYLEPIVKEASPTADTVTIQFATDMPMKLSFDIQQGKLEYYLAPRIEPKI